MNSTQILVGIVIFIGTALVAAFHHFYLPAEAPPDEPSPPPPIPAAEPPPPAVLDKVRACALAQQTFEGWYLGSNAFRHNNPGNCKGADGQFLTFKTYEAGFAYLEEYIRRVATGKHKAYPKGGKTTIQEYTRTYTSDPEPSPTNYAAAIAKALGVPVSTPMSYLLT